jgi:predicted N-acetyltransferase YhbS
MTALPALVAEELALPVDPRVTAMAAAIAARYPAASRAVLFYGSCLRETQLDGLMLDFYLIVSDYRAAYGGGWLAFANRHIPPNVFPFEHDGLVAKYAVLSEVDFAVLNSAEASSVSVWARFAQPSRLVWAADEPARTMAVAAIGGASATLFSLTLPMVSVDTPDLDIWRQGFALTYAAELRAERKGRNNSVVDADPDRYRRFGAAAREVARPIADAPRRWPRLQRHGKLLTLARLAKATTTYAGGIDYLAWKINRHADAAITIRPWQRRHPILGAISLLPRLLMKGAVR